MPAEAAEAKERGNALFAAGDFEGALALYEDAIAMAMEGVTGLASAPLGAAVFHANRAACLMKLERFEECIEACDDALDIDESYLKAMLRRAAALEKLDKLDEAVQGTLTKAAMTQQDVLTWEGGVQTMRTSSRRIPRRWRLDRHLSASVSVPRCAMRSSRTK